MPSMTTVLPPRHLRPGMRKPHITRCLGMWRVYTPRQTLFNFRDWQTLCAHWWGVVDRSYQAPSRYATDRTDDLSDRIHPDLPEATS